MDDWPNTGLTRRTQTSYVINFLFYLIKTLIMGHGLSPLSWQDALLTLCGRAEYYFLTVTAGLDGVVIEIQPECQVGMSSVLSNGETQISCHIMASRTWTEQSLWNSVTVAKEKMNDDSHPYSNILYFSHCFRESTVSPSSDASFYSPELQPTSVASCLILNIWHCPSCHVDLSQQYVMAAVALSISWGY